VFQVIKAAPAGPGEYDSDWLQLLQVLSSSQSHVWPSQHQGATSSQSHSSIIPQNTDIGSWSTTNSINDELRYSPHYWGGHTPDIQPSPSYLSSSHMTSLHSSFAPQGHSHMPPSEELIWFQKAEKAIFHYTQFISKNSRAEVLDELLVGSQG